MVATTAKYNLPSTSDLADELNNSWQFVIQNVTSELTISPEKYYFDTISTSAREKHSSENTLAFNEE